MRSKSFNSKFLCITIKLLLRADNISYKIQAINGLSEIELAKTEIREVFNKFYLVQLNNMFKLLRFNRHNRNISPRQRKEVYSYRLNKTNRSNEHLFRHTGNKHIYKFRL